MASPQLYLGTLGQTSQSTRHFAGPSGALYSCKVTTRINAERNPDLLAKLIDGTLNGFKCAEYQDYQRLDLPVMVYFPKRKLFLLVFSATSRHLVLDTLAQFTDALKQERKHPIPAFALTPKVIIGGEQIPRVLADMDEASAADSHRRKMAAEVEKLERQQVQLAEKEQLLESMTSALSEKDESAKQRDAGLALELQNKEATLIEREVELTKTLTEFEKSSAQQVSLLKEERDQLKLTLAEQEQEIAERRADMERFRRETEAEIERKLAGLETAENAAEHRELEKSKELQAGIDARVADVSKQAEDFAAKRQTVEQQLTERMDALRAEQAKFEMQKAQFAKEAARAKLELAESESQQTKAGRDAETRLAELETQLAAKREAIESQKKAFDDQKAAFERVRGQHEQAATVRDTALRGAEEKLQATANATQTKQKEIQGKLLTAREQLADRQQQIEQKAAELAKLQHELEQQSANLADREKTLSVRAADVDEKSRIYESYQSIASLSLPKAGGPDGLQTLSPPSAPGRVEVEADDSEGLEDGWDLPADIEELQLDDASEMAVPTAQMPGRKRDVTEVIPFEDIEIIDEDDIDVLLAVIESTTKSDDGVLPLQLSDADITEVADADLLLEADVDEPVVAPPMPTEITTATPPAPPGANRDVVVDEKPAADPLKYSDERLEATWKLSTNTPTVELTLRTSPAATWDTVTLSIQLHRLPTAALLTITLDGKGIGAVDFVLDPAESNVRELLTALSRNCMAKIEVKDNRAQQLQSTMVSASLEQNIELALEQAKRHIDTLAVLDVAKARGALGDPSYDRAGAKVHPFALGGFSDPLTNKLETPKVTKAALGIMSFWSSPENVDYLALTKSYSLKGFRGLQERVLKQALYFGLGMEPSMQEKAIELGLADSPTAFVQSLLGNFAEVCLNIRSNDFSVSQVWDNWELLLKACDKYSIKPEPQIEQLAKKALRDQHRRAQQRDAAEKPATIEAQIAAETYQDLGQLSPAELIGLLQYPEQRRDAAIALAKLKKSAHLTELTSVCEIMEPDEITALFPEFVGYGSSAEPVMMNLLNGSDAVLSQAAAMVLGEINAQKAAQSLLHRLGAARVNQYQAYAWALGRLGPDIRKPAVKAVKTGVIAQKRIVDAMCYVISIWSEGKIKKMKRDRTLKLIVAEALEQYGHQRFKLPSNFGEKLNKLVRVRGTITQSIGREKLRRSVKSADKDIFNVLKEL